MRWQVQCLERKMGLSRQIWPFWQSSRNSPRALKFAFLDGKPIVCFVYTWNASANTGFDMAAILVWYIGSIGAIYCFCHFLLHLGLSKSQIVNDVLIWNHSVTNYAPQTALLTLQHNYPCGNVLKAVVDVNLLLKSLKTHETAVGEWVNVMGYIKRGRNRTSTKNDEPKIWVQAILLWSSGPLNLQTYEQTIHRKLTEAMQSHEKMAWSICSWIKIFTISREWQECGFSRLLLCSS